MVLFIHRLSLLSDIWFSQKVKKDMYARINQNKQLLTFQLQNPKLNHFPPGYKWGWGLKCKSGRKVDLSGRN